MKAIRFLQRTSRIPCIFRSNHAKCLHQHSIDTKLTHSNANVRSERSRCFTEELNRQRRLVTRIEKIEVHYKGVPKDSTLIMNRHISTPYNCSQHLGEMLLKRSIVALVNGKLWDLNKPLVEDCELELIHLEDQDPARIHQANKIFWRSSAFMLGLVIDSSVKDDVAVHLHSYPSINVRSGSFIYDAKVDFGDWNPSKAEMRVFSGQMVRLSQENIQFERLEIDEKTALKMFAENPFKSSQIPNIVKQSEDGKTVVVYRLGNHVDISKGPMMGASGVLGKCSIVAMHNIDTKDGGLCRFQGVALPKGVLLNHYAYGLLEERAAQLNPAKIPDFAAARTNADRQSADENKSESKSENAEAKESVENSSKSS